MIDNKSDNKTESVCNLNYLNEMMGGKKSLIKGIMEAFLLQIPEELQSIDEAILKEDFKTIKNFAHTMKSSVSVMGISVLTPILQEMEDLGSKSEKIERIKVLNHKLRSFCKQAIEEIEQEQLNYV